MVGGARGKVLLKPGEMFVVVVSRLGVGSKEYICPF